MSVPEPNCWSLEARRPLDEFLDRVESVLLNRGAARDERATIVQELESQIFTLAARKTSARGEITQAIVQSVIEEMDPPQAYSGRRENVDDDPTCAKNQSPLQLKSPRTDPVAIGAGAAGILCFLVLLVTIAGRTGPIFGLLATICFSLAIASIGLTVWAVIRIRASADWVNRPQRDAFPLFVGRPPSTSVSTP